MCGKAIGLGLLVATVCAPTAHADTIDATATTLMIGRQDPRDGTVHTAVPFYQSLSVLATDLHSGWFKDARLVLSGWGELAAGDPLDGTQATGDVDLAYAEGTVGARRLTLRVGRQLVFGGAARALPLDGLSSRLAIGYGVGVEAYGGVPATPRFAVDQGDAAIGGRLFWRPSPILEAGASFVDVQGSGRVDRQEAGIDARIWPVSSLTLATIALWSTVEGRLAEAQARAIWQPSRIIEVSVDGARTAPDLLLPRGSIFSVFADETRDEVGGGIYLRPLRRLRLYFDAHAIDDDSGLGSRETARLTLSLGRDNATTLGTELRILALPFKDLTDVRLFGARRMTERLLFTLDIETFWLDPAVNQQTTSLTAAAGVGWDFAPGWRTVVTGIAGETPLLERRLEAMAKLVYQATVHLRQVRP